MHAEPAPVPAHAEASPAVPAPPTMSEWTIGIAFVLAALAVVILIAVTLARLPA